MAEGSAAINNHAGLIWAIADLLRGDYKQSEYGRVILPLVLLRRLDCVLEPTKAQVLARAEALAGTVGEGVAPDRAPNKVIRKSERAGVARPAGIGVTDITYLIGSDIAG